MKEHLESLLAGERLSEDALHLIFREMFAGKYSASEIAAFLVLQQKLGETYLELFAGAQAMRNAANKVVISDRVRPLTDNCGTGGDSSNSFNISTASAIVASAYGLKVAKHGNRSVSSKCGSADLLFACGLPDTLSPEQTGKLLEKTGFTFFFAPHFHPVMKHVMPVRKALRVRTIFNLLGPLANPIAPEYQVIGVGSKRYLEPMALELSMPYLTNGEIEQLQVYLDEARIALDQGDMKSLSQINTDFHKLLRSKANNHLLNQWLDSLSDRRRLVSLMIWDIENNMDQEWHEHVAILEAIKARDIPKASQALKDHIANFTQQVLAHLKNSKI